MWLHKIEKCKSMFAGFKFQGQTVFELTYKLSVIVYRNVNYCYGVNTSVVFSRYYYSVLRFRNYTPADCAF